MHDGVKCPSPRDYVDTKSWPAYEQDPYSTHWVRLGSCHRETSLGCDILPAITRLWANTNIQLLDAMTAPQCSELRGCANLPQPIQPWVVVPLPAWLGNTVASITQHLHHAATKSPRQHCRQHDSGALSLAWLDIYTASWPSYLSSVIAIITQQHRHQHDLASTSRCGQVASAAPLLAWLDIYIVPWPSHLGSTVASMTRQHYCHHDSASTSCHDQVASAALSLACLGGAIVSMTWHRHHTTAWSWTSTMTYVLSGKQTHCQLILIY
jgi:hypothetical protein